MNILLTINDITITGGTERVCVNLADALTECGHSVEILSFYRANRTLPYDTKAKLTFMHDFGEGILRDKMLSNPLKKLYFKNLHKIILSLKVWLHYKHIDIIITNDWTYAPIFRRKMTHYIKIHHLKFEGRYNKRNNLFDTLIVLSSRELSTWQRYHHNVRVIPNFIPEIPSKCTNHAQRFILSVGRMDKGDQKGFFRLLDIWKIVQDRIKDSNMNCESTHSVIANEVKQSTMLQNGLPRFGIAKSHNDSIDSQNLTQWKLIIVGDGILKKELESKIKALNLQESVILKPFTKQIEKEYLNASIYAMSSHWEGFGMVLAEASSYGLPCVAFDVKTGPSDIIENEKSGFLVADNDLQGYADKLMFLMRDENLRFNFGTKAKRVVSERFSKEVVMKEWEKLFGDKS